MASVAPRGDGDPKQQLLERAIGYLTEHGIGDISLRELAAALGTSHRMLIYHFGSKEGLFLAVVQEAENRQRRLLANLFGGDTADFAASARRFWQQLRSPELAPLERLFFELYGQALRGRGYALPILAGFIDSWIQPLIPALMAAGLSAPEARAEARLGIAVGRGLLLDVLATGDVAGADEAYERYLAASAALHKQRAGASGENLPLSRRSRSGE
jgi:AcrR family transcriptional regulator